MLTTLLIKLIMNTSTYVCGQGDKLTEFFPLEEVAQVIFLGGTDVDISHNQGVLIGVDVILQMLGQSGEGLVLGPVDGDDVYFLQVNLGHLKVGLLKVSDALCFDPFLEIGGNSFATARAHKVSFVSLQLIFVLLLLTGVQPCLLDKEDMTLH